MAFNLLNEVWIPVLKKSGQRASIAPWQITEEYINDPIISLNYPRADFNASIIQFFIGLVQICLMPKTPRDWRQAYTKPPSSESLKSSFQKKEHAFNFSGKGPLFMQDLDLSEGQAEPSHIRGLLIDSPGDNTLKNNSDLFIKRGTIDKICPACAAPALFTLQCNAPSGGKGHRVSIRGGGPLTTIVLGKTLWETIWNNILLKTHLSLLGADFKSPEEGGCFPWLAPTRLSNSGEETVPGHVHPLHLYWAMPRRIKLLFDSNNNTRCDCCGSLSEKVVEKYLTKPRGYNYNHFVHPLTPYKWDKNNNPLSLKGKNIPEGLGYRNWLGIIDADHDEKNKRTPALTVKVYRDERLGQVRELNKGTDDPDFRIWAFGFYTDNMKARFWHEGVMPVLDISSDHREEYAHWIKGLIQCADQVQKNLRQAIKQGLFHEKKDVRWNNSLLNNADTRFWKETKPTFYSTLNELRRAIENNQDTLFIRENWLKQIVKHCESIFTDFTQSGVFSSADPKRIAIAWNNMRKFNSIWAKTIREPLDLPKPGKLAE